MSTTESIELGVTFAQRAIENDRNACETDNYNLYQKAITDYSRATEMLSLAFTYEHNETTKQVLQDKITMCRDRKVLLQDYLTTFPRATSISARKFEEIATKRFNETRTADQNDLQSLFTRLNLSTMENDSLPSLKDVVGLESAKEVLQEATMLPEQFPDLFKMRRAWRTVLLYGPPGVGKTYISKAIAAESNSSFFALTAGDLMAASIDNYERVVKELFGAARTSGKVILYFDDVDILFSYQNTHETEKLRRVKGQVLKELQTLQDSQHDVVFIATSRTPWLLEEAFLRRMDRRVHASLPDAKSRTRILENMLHNVQHMLSREDIKNIARECETYSASDMKVLAMDAEMEPLRVIQDSMYFRSISEEHNGKGIRKMSPCSHDDDGAMAMRYTDIDRKELYIPSVTCLDFELALDRTKPSVGLDTVQKHVEFTRRRGQDGW